MPADLTAKHFHDDEAAREFLESVRWPDGPVCPHCGVVAGAYETSKAGRYRCGAAECRKDFTVMVGTVFERSHIPLHKWLMASHLMAASKKGVSAHQLHRMLGITYKSAWFMAHRIRESMTPNETPRMGGGGKAVEMDETYIGTAKGKVRRHSGAGHKRKVVSLVERSGKVRSFHVDSVNRQTVLEILFQNVSKEASLMTDESSVYAGAAKYVGSHDKVNHGEEEYVSRTDPNVHTNTIEGFFSIFKRGMIGVYQHCGEQHLKRYLTEFDFRYSNRAALGVSDKERALLALKGIEGKRLTYGGSQARRAS